jgi:large repetitive protein
MRFPYIEGGGVGTAGNPDTVAPTGGGPNALYSAQRAQPYRGGHAVRLPGDTGTTTLNLPLDTRYGYSEQTTAPTFLSTTYGVFGTAGKITQTPVGGTATGGSIYHTLGKNNDNPEPWDWFVFNDRDFTSVAELMLVPGCPPGLFTKQFVELPPMVPSTAPVITAGVYTNFPVPVTATAPTGGTALTFPPVNPPAAAPTPASVAPAAPNAYSYTAPTAIPLQPHTYPYLVDKFFYSGASLPAPTTGATGPAPPFLDTDTAGQSVNTASSDGWFKMFEFFEVPSQMIGSIGSVASGTNFDWMRQDTKPGLLNLNLVIDEEVFFSILGRQTYNNSVAGVDQFTQTLLNFTQLTPANEANLIPQIVNTANAMGGVSGTYSMLANGQSGVLTGDWLHPQGAGPALGLVNNGMKAAFAQFLLMRHGSVNLFNFTGERPFHSLSYPDIDFTVMRPATLPLAAGATSNPPLTAAAATALTPYASGSYAGDPGV